MDQDAGDHRAGLQHDPAEVCEGQGDAKTEHHHDQQRGDMGQQGRERARRQIGSPGQQRGPDGKKASKRHGADTLDGNDDQTGGGLAHVPAISHHWARDEWPGADGLPWRGRQREAASLS